MLSLVFKSMVKRPYLTVILAALLLGLTYLGTSFVDGIIDGYVQQGRLEERSKWQGIQTAAIDKLNDEHKAERIIARKASKRAAVDRNKLIDELEFLRNVKETECKRISDVSVGLLNDAATAYNNKRGH